MKFGKVEFTELENIDFHFPEDFSKNQEVLGKQKVLKPNVYVGCPIWVNKNWIGKIYPHNAKEKDFLKYYAQQFDTIELNSTHYHLPDTTSIERWRQKVGKNFRFCPKILQTISHHQLLARNYKELTEKFCQIITSFEQQLGICFLQLPPYFDADKVEFLEEFLTQFPKEIPLAVEFRHATWFDNQQKALKNLLEVLQK